MKTEKFWLQKQALLSSSPSKASDAMRSNYYRTNSFNQQNEVFLDNDLSGSPQSDDFEFDHPVTVLGSSDFQGKVAGTQRLNVAEDFGESGEISYRSSTKKKTRNKVGKKKHKKEHDPSLLPPLEVKWSNFSFLLIKAQLKLTLRFSLPKWVKFLLNIPLDKLRSSGNFIFVM